VFSQKLLQNILIGVLVVLLVGGGFWAWWSGTRAGKSSVVVKNIDAIQTGLKYFYTDQNRYPTAVEFQDQNIMLSYMSPLPLQPVIGGSCSQTYRYSSANPRTYELEFCLPKASGGFAAGWNKVQAP
jgi:hypothetical protein